MTLPVHPDIQISATWDHSRAAYTLTVDWSALYPEFDENVSFRVEAFKGDEAVSDRSTVSNIQELWGIPHESDILIQLVAFVGMDDVKYYTTSFTTAIGLPGQLINYDVQQETDSLHITWTDIPFAEGYRARIYLEGQLLEAIDSAVPQVAFHGLPHSRRFTIEVQPYNSLNDGDVTTFETHTTYLVPPAPINLRQHEERIIAVILQWEIVAPEIISEVQIQAWDGEEMFLEDTMNAWQEERSIPCPSTGSTYLFKLRAGNPAGWSEWVEFEGHTEVFPLVDSRLAALGASYQENELRVDTWNHSLNAAGPLMDTVRVGATFEVAPDGYIIQDAGIVPVEQWVEETADVTLSPTLSMYTRILQLQWFIEERADLEQQPSFTMELVLPQIEADPFEQAIVNQTPGFSMYSELVQYMMDFSDTAGLEQVPTFSMTLELANEN